MKNLIFSVYEADYYGRPDVILGYFKAGTREEAREIAAKHFNIPEIVTTGYYGSSEISKYDLNKKITQLQKELEKCVII